MWWSKKTNFLIAAGAFVFMSLGIYYYSTSDVESYQELTSTVSKRDISLQVIERGVIKPARVVPIKSLLSSNQAKVIWMEKEGKIIQKGDLIAQFDTKPFHDKFGISKQDLVDAKLRLSNAQNSIALKQEEIHEKLREAKRNQEIAKIESDDLQYGDGKLEREKRVKQVRVSTWKTHLTKEKYNAFIVLYEKGHLSKRELEVTSNNYNAARDDLKIAELALRNFDSYEWPRLIRKSNMLIEGAKSDIERIKRTSGLELAKMNEEIKKLNRDVAAYQLKLSRAQLDIDHCKVYAPANGLLLYADIPTPNGRRKVHIGDAIWVGQMFMTIPDTEDLIVEIKVREVDIAKLSIGLSASLQIDAFNEDILIGEVTRIDSLAKEDSGTPFVRTFLAEIRISNVPAYVHVGMSATATINYQQVQNALSVSTNAIEYKDGSPVVQIAGKSAEKRLVRLGIIGNKWAEVVSGLSEGDNVVIRSYN